jgi:signal transduction histidine kinase
MKRLWTRSLAGQMVVLMLLALVLSHVVSFVIYRDERTQALRGALKEEFLARTAAVTRLLDGSPSELHREILRAGASGITRYWLGPEPTQPADWQEQALLHLRQPLPASLHPDQPEPPADAAHAVANPYLHGIEMHALPSASWEVLAASAWPLGRQARLMQLNEWNGFGLAVPLRNGVWLNAVYAKPGLMAGATYQTFLSLGIAALALTLVAMFIARWIARPLKEIAHAAERVGLGEEVAPVRECGPDDLRCMAAAFNRMQTRLRRFIEDRTRMLAAVGHDLRTPITSLRLRAEFVRDEDTRKKLIDTLDEMQSMTEATLAFARDDAAREETRNVELSALMESLCADLGDLGWDVKFNNGDKIPYRCRPDSLRRAARNLIENAVRYGERARVTIAAKGDSIELTIEDDGKGIPDAEKERVFQPFVRLEESRNSATGGVGLGLSIARGIVRSHGGDIALRNERHGLHAVITLPRSGA